MILGLTIPILAYSATLIPVKVKCETGQKSITLPIDLKTEPSERVSGIQFDINIPPGTKITGMNVGDSARKSNKMVSYNQIKTQTYRTIVAGLNQSPISDGTVLFIHIAIEDTALTGKQIVKLTNIVLADPEGNSVNSKVLPGEILFPGGETSPETQPTGLPTSDAWGNFPFTRKHIGIVLIVIVGVLIIAGIFIRIFIIHTKQMSIPQKQNKKPSHKK